MKFIERTEFTPSISPVTDLAHFLQMELFERQAKNKSYSLRSFARDIDISPAHLSQIISRQRVPSDLMAEKCLKHLKLTKEQKAVICATDVRSALSENEVIVDSFEELNTWCEIVLISTIKSFPGIHLEDILTENLGSKGDVLTALEKLERLEVIYSEREMYFPIELKKSMYKSMDSDDTRITFIKSLNDEVLERIYDNFNMVLMMNKEDLGYAATKMEQFFINLTQDLAKRRNESASKELIYLTSMTILSARPSQLSKSQEN